MTTEHDKIFSLLTDKTTQLGVGERVELLGIFIILSEDPGLIPSTTYIMAHNCYLSLQFWRTWYIACKWYKYLQCRQNTHFSHTFFLTIMYEKVYKWLFLLLWQVACQGEALRRKHSMWLRVWGCSTSWQGRMWEEQEEAGHVAPTVRERPGEGYCSGALFCSIHSRTLTHGMCHPHWGCLFPLQCNLLERPPQTHPDISLPVSKCKWADTKNGPPHL